MDLPVTRSKICGITNIADARFAVSAGSDALGFNFYNKSPRYVSPEIVGEIVQDLPPFVTAVGIFVNAERESIERIADIARLSALQLHGDETPTDCEGYTRPVIRAIRVGDRLEAKDVQPYADAGVTAFLLDTANKGLYGGTGEAFEWSVAASAKVYGRVILAGGLTAENVKAGIAAVAPYGVDTASGVEKAPGVKDHAKVKAFLTAVRESRES